MASRWSGDDNAIFPDRIEIDGSKIIYYKGNFVGCERSIMGRDKIASVHLRSSLLFADIVIESSGGKEVIGR